ncbi:MAG TPA: aspartate aminotransferase family protein [Firmicutes bacterium]|nr:aspartate aminotransferase family protein [Bacillota bacterium]
MDRSEIRRLYSEYVNPGFISLLKLLDFDKRFVKAEGVEVWDQDGNVYLDFLGAFGALNLGHNPPEVWAALEKARVCHPTNLLQALPGAAAAALAHNLAQVTPGELKRCFFTNSGTETVEAALKMSRAATGRGTILYCEGSFHGKTFGSLSVTGREKYQKPFAPLLPGCEKVPYGDLAALESRLQASEVAAFIVEPIQGEGGVRVPPEGYLKAAEELCHKYGTLLIVDEIQTGLGRTGRLFACEHEGVRPDIMCISKSLGGGLVPIGACIATEKVWNAAYGGLDRCMLHTSTFGGNTLACLAGIAALEAIVQRRLWENAAELGSYMLNGLKAIGARCPAVKEVRGRGLLIGVEFDQPVKGLLDKVTAGMINKAADEYIGAMVAGELLNRHHVITAYTLNNPNVMRLEPPLTVTREQVNRVLQAVEEVLSQRKSFWGLAVSTAKTAAASLFKGA